MAVYVSVCPGCNELVTRTYGEMGEGLLCQSGCRCRMERLTAGDWLTLAVIVLAMALLAL